MSAEFQYGDLKTSTAGDSESIVILNEPSNPPPYSSARSVGLSSSSSTFLPPRCNYFLEQKNTGTIKGTWHVDPSLSIPESILSHITNFDGNWNRDVQNARVNKRSSSSEVRPNLMLKAVHGTIEGDVHVMSNNGDRAVIVAEARNGPVHLVVNAPQSQVLRIHAYSDSSEVIVWIPSAFEGVLMMDTSRGDTRISEGVKAKFSTFSSISNQSRGFIGDWRASGFGTAQSDDGSHSTTTENAFTTWSGSMVQIKSGDGLVSLAFVEERPLSAIEMGWVGLNQVKSFFSGLFGRAESATEPGTSLQG